MGADPEKRNSKSLAQVAKGVEAGPAADSVASVQVPISWGRIATRLLVLAGLVSLAGLIAWVRNERIYGDVGAELALFSMLGCGGFAALALLVVGLTAGGPRGFAGLLVSILLRTLGPLALGVVWLLLHPEWPVKNLIEVHVSLFLVSLTVETILVVDIVSNSVRSVSSLNDSTPGKGRASR